MPGFNLYQIAGGALLALILASLAYAVRALSISGSVAAFCLGTILFGLGGLSWAALLLAFFIPSSLLSFLFKQRKSKTEESYQKGSRRDAWQVLANGGIAGVAAIAHTISPGSLLPWLAASAALAAASADTWATELGALSRKEPRLITSGKKVSRGTSGGISIEGEGAALAGALTIAIVSALLLPEGAGASGGFSYPGWILLVTAGGFIGCQVDSLFGATLQVIYYCPVCRKETEKHPLHSCGTETIYKQGIRWMNNDWVNLFCTASAVLIASLLVFVTLA